MSQIILTTPIQRQPDHQAITIEQYQKRKVQRRRRVAKRMLKRFPLFAVEIMQAEFPDYTYEEFIGDVTRKTRKGKSMRRPKSPLIRQGRYPLYQNAMSNYGLTGEQKYLEEAQHWRNRLYLPFQFLFALKGERRLYEYPSTLRLQVVDEIKAIKGYQTWEELDAMIKHVTRWSHIS
jgi:hypothetical protein